MPNRGQTIQNPVTCSPVNPGTSHSRTSGGSGKGFPPSCKMISSKASDVTVRISLCTRARYSRGQPGVETGED